MQQEVFNPYPVSITIFVKLIQVKVKTSKLLFIPLINKEKFS